MRWYDSLTNFAAQLGTGKSKVATDAFLLRGMDPNELSAIYRSDWLGRKIIDAPVFDMFREWRNWQADPKQVELIETQEERWRVQSVLARAVLLARLYGGSIILIGADVANPEMPLNLNAIKRGSLKYLTALSCHEVTATEIERDPRSQNFGLPKYYEINSSEVGQIRVHPSRVLRFIGADRLDTLHVHDGWGDSVLAAVYDAIHHAALAQGGIAELIHEAKVDVIHIPNLASQFSTDAATSQMVKRFTTANTLKSINNMLLLDTQETWERKQTSFSGLPEILDRYLAIVSGASDIPATRLLGQAAKGLNATGEGDLRNYYDMIAAQRQVTIGPNLSRLDDILWRDATGAAPPKGVYAEWRPLWQLGEKEQADIAKSKAETTKIYIDANVIDENTLRLGVQNQLIEDGTYPGLEQAIEQLRLAGVDPTDIAAPENDNTEADRAVSDRRNGFPRLTYAAR